MATSVPTAGRAAANLAAHPCRATRSGMCSIHRIYDFAVFCLP
jgi:hypothetical protein